MKGILKLYLICLICFSNVLFVIEFRDLTEEDLLLMCDLFYLPFEHGPQSVQYLTEFNWLKSNAHLVSKENHKLKKNNLTESKPEVSVLFMHLNENKINSDK